MNLFEADTFATYDENWNMPTTIQKTARYFRGFPIDVTAVIPHAQSQHLLLITPGGCFDYDMNTQRLTNNDAFYDGHFRPLYSSTTMIVPTAFTAAFAIANYLQLVILRFC